MEWTFSWPALVWAWAAIGLAVCATAQVTASALWRAGLERHTRAFALATPAAAVEPLRPADRH